MTLGELIDALERRAADKGIELNRVDWTRSRNFENLRIGARRMGDVEQGRVVVLRKKETQSWTAAHARRAISDLAALLDDSR